MLKGVAVDGKIQRRNKDCKDTELSKVCYRKSLED